MSAKFKNVHAQTLWELSQGDESTLQYALPDAIFGFHVQQAVEKILKAWLTTCKVDYPKTHSLQKLADLLTAHGEQVQLAPVQLAVLEPFAVTLRYDHGDSLEEDERSAMKQMIIALRSSVSYRIQELES